MDLSIIIVNYNVKFFLEQCLYSVQKAVTSLSAEIIVIDNHSSDNSLSYLQPIFPTTRFISNPSNSGFAKACNQGLALASGKYILFLNPDTIVSADSITQSINFLDLHSDAGALGIRMIDGSGRFLKESKRSFPSPVTSLYKLFGLARLFPQSAVFSKYHLGGLDENKTHEVDVLAGAFMMVKKEALDKIGGFDETFFMYGEDVDLSYRIKQAGYKNYYFADSTIIHFKGESTRRGSMNYVKMFYSAMGVFVRKHYGGSKANIFNFFIHLAIWIRAAMAAVAGFTRRAGLPLIDAGIIFLSFWIMKDVWGSYIKKTTQYEPWLLSVAFPAFTIVYLITAYYAGLYDRWYKRSQLLRSTFVATIVLLAAYSLLPEHFRFSRGIVLFGAMLAFVLISLLRWVLIKTGVLESNKEKKQHASTLIVATKEQYEEVVQLISGAGFEEKILGRVAVQENDPDAIGYWTNLENLQRTVPFSEVIFCQGYFSYENIVACFQSFGTTVKLKIHAAGSHSIVSSDSKNSSGEALSKETPFNLADPYYRRQKRLLDICVVVVGIISFPIQLFIVKKPLRFFSNCFTVLFAKKTWIGYNVGGEGLPVLRVPVITCSGNPYFKKTEQLHDSLLIVDYWYAREYELPADIRLLWKAYRSLGS